MHSMPCKFSFSHCLCDSSFCVTLTDICLIQDFDLCIPCYKSTGHEHKMDKVGFGIDDGTLGVGSGSNTNKSGQISVDTCLRSLVHACQCKNANCNMPACYTMKKVYCLFCLISVTVLDARCFLRSCNTPRTAKRNRKALA